MVVRRQRTLPAPPEEVWSVVSDPSSLPRWWPGLTRVEHASPEAWTKVLSSPKGKLVRADYTLVEADRPRRLLWRQEVEESPFERILSASTTEIALEPDGGGTRVAIAVNHRPRGWARFSPFQMRAAARRQVQGALEGLAGVLGGAEEDR